jgi:hypothetical protein
MLTTDKASGEIVGTNVIKTFIRIIIKINQQTNLVKLNKDTWLTLEIIKGTGRSTRFPSIYPDSTHCVALWFSPIVTGNNIRSRCLIPVF